MFQSTEKKPTGSTKSLALGFLLAAFIACLLVAPRPAHASTTFTVNSTGDGSDKEVIGDDLVCDGSLALGSQCTLRAAMEEANETPGLDIIEFDIPGSGVKTIKPKSHLPEITDRVTIDGYSQPGASPNTRAVGNDAILKIELNGIDAGNTVGLNIRADKSVVKGLVINRFVRSGIEIRTSGSEVEGNFIGTDPSGTAGAGNLYGVSVLHGPDNTIGGNSPAARNVISGNEVSGVSIEGGGGQKVLGNYIGTTKAGAGPLGNSGSGVYIAGGVILEDVSNNTVGGGSSRAANIIAFNGMDGITVSYGTFAQSVGNRMLRNSIFSNDGLGINLDGDGVTLGIDGSTANDPGDADGGPNQLQNKPELTSANTSGDETTVKGKLSSTPDTTFRIELFSNPAGNEGQEFIGRKNVTTDASGKANFTFTPAKKVPAGRTATATATDTDGNTSEFSASRTVEPA